MVPEPAGTRECVKAGFRERRQQQSTCMADYQICTLVVFAQGRLEAPDLSVELAVAQPMLFVVVASLPE
ncbi:hypothetical protein A0H81_04243 [Grifola frondosa]|uniref:Uncharacterized protein n=1 Tax=Grifola frondosa TaxID=5627 RepID=A0A1C7MDY1_GRIFR|nr:hypothetical protein A0H81_04243 [Grifola frondosa]